MSYDQLRSIVDENKAFQRDEMSTPPEACPDCGEPLEAGPRGELHCPWDGFVWAG